MIARRVTSVIVLFGLSATRFFSLPDSNTVYRNGNILHFAKMTLSAFIVLYPILNCLLNPRTLDTRPGDCLYSFCCVGGWVHDHNLGSTRGVIPTVLIPDSTVELIVKTTAKNKLGM